MGKLSSSEWMMDTNLENAGTGYQVMKTVMKVGEREHSDSGFREKQNGLEEGVATVNKT